MHPGELIHAAVDVNIGKLGVLFHITFHFSAQTAEIIKGLKGAL